MYILGVIRLILFFLSVNNFEISHTTCLILVWCNSHLNPSFPFVFQWFCFVLIQEVYIDLSVHIQ